MDKIPLVASTGNPLPEFINSIPWEPTLVDADLLDTLRRVINKCTADRVIVSNSYVVLLMQFLAENGYLDLVSVPVTVVPGNLSLVKRVK